MLEVPDLVWDLDLDWIGSLVFDTPMIQILALNPDFEVAKNINILQFLILGFEGHWRSLSGVRHLDRVWI